MRPISPKRFASTTFLDIRMQYRNGFYFVLIVVLISSIVVMSQLPNALVSLIFPIFLMSNVITGTYLFMGVLVLYERNQNIPTALNVVPLSPHEYLLAKITTLTLLGFIEGGCIILYCTFIKGVQLEWLNQLAGLFLLALLYNLIGFIVVTKYQEFGSFMSKGILVALPLSLPFVNFFTNSTWVRLLLFVSPTNPALLLMTQSTLFSIPTLVFIILSVIWIGLFYRLAVKFHGVYYEQRRTRR